MILFPVSSSYGHLYGYNYQEWKNQKGDMLIQFDTVPQTPVAGSNSTLNFSIQNLMTGEHVDNFTETVTVVYQRSDSSSGGVAYKFPRTHVMGGDFSHVYTFSSGGTYEILLRIDTANAIDVAKFTVFVSSTQFQIMNMVYLLLPAIIFIAILIAVTAVIARYIYKKR